MIPTTAEIMASPAVAFHEDLMNGRRNEVYVPLPHKEMQAGSEDYDKRLEEDKKFKMLIDTSINFIKVYPDSMLTNRQIIHEAAILAYGDHTIGLWGDDND